MALKLNRRFQFEMISDLKKLDNCYFYQFAPVAVLPELGIITQTGLGD